MIKLPRELESYDPYDSSQWSSDMERTMTEYYKTMKSPAPDFTPEIWEDVGQSLLIALLDYDGINPISRLVSSPFDDLA